jgi:hypothetical protein
VGSALRYRNTVDLGQSEVHADSIAIAREEVTQMARFYFHVRSNGELAQDGRGRDCKDARAACAFAIKSMPGHLRKGLKATSTHVSTQICDDQDETIAVVRGTVTIERWRAAFLTALSPRFQSSPPVP